MDVCTLIKSSYAEHEGIKGSFMYTLVRAESEGLGSRLGLRRSLPRQQEPSKEIACHSIDPYPPKAGDAALFK